MTSKPHPAPMPETAFDTHSGQIYHPRAMGQRAVGASERIFFAARGLLIVLSILFAPAGCDRKPAAKSISPAAKRPSVASLVPAATDLLIGMGAGDHLVAVSTWDADRPEIAGLPKV